MAKQYLTGSLLTLLGDRSYLVGTDRLRDDRPYISLAGVFLWHSHCLLGVLSLKSSNIAARICV